MTVAEPPAGMMKKLGKLMGNFPEWRVVVIRQDALAMDLFKQIFGGN